MDLDGFWMGFGWVLDGFWMGFGWVLDGIAWVLDGFWMELHGFSLVSLIPGGVGRWLSA